MDRDILAILCPDWRGAALVIEAPSLQVLYANWPCLELVHRGDLLRIADGRLIFTSPDMELRFGRAAGAVGSAGSETTVLMDAGTWSVPSYAIAIHRPQGLLREALVRRTGKEGALVVVELATAEQRPTHEALAAFAQAFGLTGADFQLVASLARGKLGIADLSGADPVARELTRRSRAIAAKLGCRDTMGMLRLIMTLCSTKTADTSDARAEIA